MGCTRSDALNYRFFALVEDGTCILGGCIDSLSPYFDAEATYDDGSCPPRFFGCTDSLAANYRSIANVDDGSCLYVGCMDSLAVDYDQFASLPSTCTPRVVGCMGSLASNYFDGAKQTPHTAHS